MQKIQGLINRNESLTLGVWKFYVSMKVFQRSSHCQMSSHVADKDFTLQINLCMS